MTTTTHITATFLALTISGCTTGGSPPTPAANDVQNTRAAATTAPPRGDSPATSDHARILRDVTTPVVLALTVETVRCSALGYGSSELKVSVPDLVWLAHFDHRSGGEGLPCMTAGICTDERSPEQILTTPFVTTDLRVTLTEHLTIDAEAATCSRHLEEDVMSTVAGLAFSHHRAGEEETLDYALCQELAKL